MRKHHLHGSLASDVISKYMCAAVFTGYGISGAISKGCGESFTIGCVNDLIHCYPNLCRGAVSAVGAWQRIEK